MREASWPKLDWNGLYSGGKVGSLPCSSSYSPNHGQDLRWQDLPILIHSNEASHSAGKKWHPKRQCWPDSCCLPAQNRCVGRDMVQCAVGHMLPTRAARELYPRAPRCSMMYLVLLRSISERIGSAGANRRALRSSACATPGSVLALCTCMNYAAQVLFELHGPRLLSLYHVIVRRPCLHFPKRQQQDDIMLAS